MGSMGRLAEHDYVFSIPWLVNLFTTKTGESLFIKTYLIIVGLYGFLSWHLGTGLGINLTWFLSIALWVITEVLQSLYTPVLRILVRFSWNRRHVSLWCFSKRNFTNLINIGGLSFLDSAIFTIKKTIQKDIPLGSG